MREDYASLPMNMHDDGFGEFDTPDLGRDDANPTIDVIIIIEFLMHNNIVERIWKIN